MNRLAKTLLVVLLFLVALLVGHHNAQAASQVNTPDPRLDATASSVAGHPVTVYCENDMAEWAKGDAPSAAGYTYAPHWNFSLPVEKQNVVWIHPWYCGILHQLLTDRAGTSLQAAAAAIHVLVHESVHQQDGVYGDCTTSDQSCEGRTDCRALQLDEGVAINSFGFPATMSISTAGTKTVVRTVRRKVRGHWRRLQVKRTVNWTTWATVRNTALDVLGYWQRENHVATAKAYPAYGGGC